MENDDRYAVPDTWEEAADDSASKLLQQKIEEAAKLKQLQQQNSQINPDMNGEQETKLITGVPVIRILKRPESSGELNDRSVGGGVHFNKNNVSSVAARISPSSSINFQTTQKDATQSQQQILASNAGRTLEERVTAYAQARERIFGVVDQGIHEELPILPKLVPRTTASSPTISQTSAPLDK